MIGRTIKFQRGREQVAGSGPPVEKLREHWPGSPEGLAQLRRLLRIEEAGAS